MRIDSLKKGLLIMMAVLAVAAAGFPAAGAQEKPGDTAGSKAAENAVNVTEWLLLGPIAQPFPAFSAENGKDRDADFLLSYKDLDLDQVHPDKGMTENIIGGTISWTVAGADTSGVLIPVSGSDPQVTYLASYIRLPRWMKIEAEFKSSEPFEVFIDGTSVAKSGQSTGTGMPGKAVSGKADLKQGKHLMIVKTVMVPADTVRSWRFAASLKPGEGFDESPVATLDPVHELNISNVLNYTNISRIEISPDGKLVLISYWKFIPPDGEREMWFEIRHLPSGKLERTIKESSMTNVQWAPDGRRLSYISRDKGKGSVRCLDLETGVSSTILPDIKDLSRYTWSPDGTYIVYYTDTQTPDDGTGITRLSKIQDRSGAGRSTTSTFIASVPEGITRKLTAGKYESYVSDITPDGRRMLVQRSYEDLTKRPYYTNDIYILDMDDMSTRMLCSSGYLNGAVWSPDGKKVLIAGGPSIFGDKGVNVTGDKIPNDYDGQLYILDPATGEVDPITRDFDPAVTGFAWSRADGRIYVVAESGELVKLYSYDTSKRKFKEIDTGVEVVSRYDISLNTREAVIGGSGAEVPEKIFYIDLRKGKSSEIAFPGESVLARIRYGKCESFDFTSEKGAKIIGTVYYPPDFDSSKKYPCIVYYYGGTSPVDRRFGGRWPENLWAGKGYVIYIMQPTGATGFGQDFSAGHVNDWGKTTADEIIYGTKKFLEAHPFVNPYRVGCMGASYGGFMTELLITRTDIFAAAVSHAGISMIPSYWGQGYWGYTYNSVSAANSFPWNRKDIYVDQSPLFSADKINTPLLLLHGAADTNVPTGESDQLFTALKLLGKEVEFIKFAGQNHFILDYKKRKAWSDAQMAWFDKWLKDQPEWWNSMYPPAPEGEKPEPKKMKPTRIVMDSGNVILMGQVTRDDITREIPDWDREYFDYTPDAGLIPEISDKIMDVDITCVLGTWCPDSRREIPRLWKILEEAGYPLDELTMYAVGSSRFTVESPIPAVVYKWSKDVKAYYGIERVATIVLSRNGKEIGRIVETPGETLEKDLVNILSAK